MNTRHRIVVFLVVLLAYPAPFAQVHAEHSHSDLQRGLWIPPGGIGFEMSESANRFAENQQEVPAGRRDSETDRNITPSSSAKQSSGTQVHARIDRNRGKEGNGNILRESRNYSNTVSSTYLRVKDSASPDLSVGAEQIEIDIGTVESTPLRGFGWREQNEVNGTNTFCWIAGMEADLNFDLKNVRPLRVAIWARPFYYDNCTQRFALFVNNRYVDEWICEMHPEWYFDRYETTVPVSALIEGRNRLTIRCAYASETGERGLSLAVDKIRLSPADASASGLSSELEAMDLIVAAIFVILLVAWILVRRMKK